MDRVRSNFSKQAAWKPLHQVVSPTQNTDSHTQLPASTSRKFYPLMLF